MMFTPGHWKVRRAMSERQHQHDSRLEMLNCIVDQLISFGREYHGELDKSSRVAHFMHTLRTAQPELSHKEVCALAAVAIDRLAQHA